MKTEQEIRTEAIKEAMSAVKSLKVKRDTWTYPEKADVHNFAVDDCLEELKDLLPTLPPEPTVSDELLDAFINNLKRAVGQKETYTARVDLLLPLALEVLSLRTAKAEPYQWKKGDIVRLKNGCNGIFESDYFQTHDGTIEKITNTEDEGIHVRGIVDKVYLHFCRPQDLRLVKSAEPEKAAPSLVDKIKEMCEKGLSAPASNDYNKGWDNCAREILSMISEAQNGK